MRFIKYNDNLDDFFKSICDAKLEYHLDDNPAEIVNNLTGEQLFTDDEALYLGETLPILKEKYGWDEVWNIFIKHSHLANEQ